MLIEVTNKMVNYYQDENGEIHAVVDMKVFREYYPSLELKEISYKEYMDLQYLKNKAKWPERLTHEERLLVMAGLKELKDSMSIENPKLTDVQRLFGEVMAVDVAPRLEQLQTKGE